MDALICQCCGHEIDDEWVGDHSGVYHSSCRRALIHEREACAQIAANYWIGFPDADNEAAHRASVEIPQLILNR